MATALLAKMKITTHWTDHNCSKARALCCFGNLEIIDRLINKVA